MGVMSIPCCAPTPPPKPPVDGGPVLVKAGWYHFLVMGIGGQVNTFVASPQLAYMTGTKPEDRKYWKRNWGNDEVIVESDVSLWPTQGDSGRTSKYLEGDRQYHPWTYADCSYNIAEKKFDEDCPARTINVEIETFGTIFYNHPDTSRDSYGTCNTTPDDPTTGLKCNQKCIYRPAGYYPFRYDKSADPIPTARPWYLQPYLNFNGTSEGMGVTLYDSDPGSKGLPELINPYSPAQLAPPGHPLETPEIPLGVKDIECGAYHNIVRLADNSIMAWGLNSMGQCNVPESLLPDHLRPAGVRPHPNRQNICSLHAGFSTSAVMFNNGTVLCWGDPKVADKVNTWEHLRTSLIKTNALGIQECCIGAPSVGYPECLPGTDCDKPENWVPENKYKTGRYNANNDWEGYWHKGASPAYPHFDLGTETEYVYPVNFGHVVKLSSNEIGSHAGSSDGPAGSPIPSDTDEIVEGQEVDVPQYSYRYAKQWPSIGKSRCADKGKIVGDFAVGMLRTGQIVTSRTVNTPNEDKDRKYCRDCDQDGALDRTDGSYLASNKGPAANLDSFEICANGRNPDEQSCIRAPGDELIIIDCRQLLTVDSSIVVDCGGQKTCESKKRWFVPSGICDGFKDGDCADGDGSVPPSPEGRNLCTGVRRPEGIGCFSSTDDEEGYDPNWQGPDKYVSAGHVRGSGTRHAGSNNVTYPKWNLQQADYGWASLPTPQDRFKPLTAKGYPIHPLCQIPGTYISACVNYFDTNAPCESECLRDPDEPGANPNGNRSATPALNGQGDLPGSAGFFHYPAHMHSFGCVAGTNAVTWLGPADLLNRTLTEFIMEEPPGNDIKLTDKASSAILSYTQDVYSNSYKTDVCEGCKHVGSHPIQTYNACKLSHGVIYNNREPDPDGMINPLSGQCKCVLTDCQKFDLLNTTAFQSAIKPSKPWGPWQIAQNLGIMSSPPIMEFGNILDKIQAPIWDVGSPEINWNKKTDDATGKSKDDPKSQDGQNPFFVTNNKTLNYSEALSQPESFIATNLKLDWPQDFRTPMGNSRAWAHACDCGRVCWADDELNGQGTGLGGDGIGCANGGSLDETSVDTCSGSYFYDCSNTPKKYNPNGKELQKTGSGFTLYSNFPNVLPESYTVLQAFSPDRSKVVTCTNAVGGTIKLEIWNISDNHTLSNVFIRYHLIEQKDTPENNTFNPSISDPISMNWMKDGTLLIGMKDKTIINFIEIPNILAVNITYRPIKFLIRHWLNADNDPMLNEWSQEYSVDINDSDMLNRIAVDNRTSNKYLGFHTANNSNTTELIANNKIHLYKPCDIGLCPPDMDLTSTKSNGNEDPYEPSKYKYYIKVGDISIFDALSVARRNALDFVGSTTGSEITPFNSNCLKPFPFQCLGNVDLNGNPCGTVEVAGSTLSTNTCPWSYDEPWQWVYGGHADRILFTGTGDLVINSNDFFTTVYWGLKGITNEQIQGNEKLILGLDDTRYTQTAKYELAPKAINGSELYGKNLLQGLRNNHIYVNDDSTKVGVVGFWIGDPLNGFIDPGRSPGYWYSAAVTSYTLSWGLTSSSKFDPAQEISTTLIDGDGFRNEIRTGFMPIEKWEENQETFVKFDNTISHAIIGRFDNWDRPRVRDFNTVNLLTNSYKRYGDVFGDDYLSGRSIYTSFGVLPNNRFFLTTTTSSLMSGADPLNPKIPNGIVIDGNIDYVTGAFPLWNRRLCGARSCLGLPPDKGWTGGGNYGCADAFGFDNSVGTGPREDITKGYDDLVCPNCDKTSNDGYSRWGFSHPSISHASGRSWSVHLRDLPWFRDRDRASIFYKKHHCEETEEYGLSDYFDSDGFTKQKSRSHVTGNYNNIKIWVTGNMVDPCPPWPLASWDPDNGIDDIDIELPQSPTNTQTVVIDASTIGPNGLTYDEGTIKTMTVRHCGKYPSWVPVPNTSVSDTDKQPGRSYKGIWQNGEWHSGLYGISAGKLEGFPIAPGISAQNINDINTIVDAVGISAAYQSSCVTCETAWTEPLPPVSNIVGRTFFRQGYDLDWFNTTRPNDDLFNRSSCDKLELGACCKQDMSGITQCFYGTKTACGYTLGHIDADISLSWGFTAGIFHTGIKCGGDICS